MSVGKSTNTKNPISRKARKMNRDIEASVAIMIPNEKTHAVRKVAKRLPHQRQYTPVHFQTRRRCGQQVS
jgi:hypothetical protein